MNTLTQPIRRTIFCALLCGFVVGCEGSYIVKGKVTRANTPLKTSERENLSVRFIREDNPLYTFEAETRRDGSFVVMGLKRKGIPTGKYRIAIQLAKKNSTKDKLDGQFGPATTNIIRDVKGNQEINIDLDHPDN